MDSSQTGGGFLNKFFGLNSPEEKFGNRPRRQRDRSSIDSETGYHLTEEQKRIRQLDTRGKINYSRAVESEKNLIDNYESLARVSQQYYKTYNRHLGNLITLDDTLGIHGLEKTFKNQIIKNVFKGNDVVDRTNPLLLRNYLVSNSTLPRNFRKEHLLSQVRYILRKFNPKDELLIQSIDVSLEGRKAMIKLRGLNGDLYERSAAVDEDFNIDMNDLKRNLREVLQAIKRKMDFEIEIVSDFQLNSEDMEIPGLNFLDDDNALARRLKDLDMRRTINAEGPIPLSQMSTQSKRDKKLTPKKNRSIFAISAPKPKTLPKGAMKPIPDQGIPGDQGFGEARAIEKKPFALDETLNKILQGGPTAFNPEAAAAAAPTGAPGQQQQGAPAMNNRQPGPGMNNRQPGIDTRDELEKKCNGLTSQPEECKKTIGCYYNTKINKCHRDTKI